MTHVLHSINTAIIPPANTCQFFYGPLSVLCYPLREPVLRTEHTCSHDVVAQDCWHPQHAQTLPYLVISHPEIPSYAPNSYIYIHSYITLLPHANYKNNSMSLLGAAGKQLTLSYAPALKHHFLQKLFLFYFLQLIHS